MHSHDALLEQWSSSAAHAAGDFILDGIIDYPRWDASRVKVVFLLKEAYGETENKEGWDLRKVIREDWHGPKYQTYTRVAEWAYAVQHHTEKPQFPKTSAAVEDATNCLLASAIVNIKKSHGRSASDMTEIRELAQRDGELLRQQIELIRPSVVVCGGTWPAVKHLWNAQESPDLIYQTADISFIDVWHPAARFPAKLSYYTVLHLTGIALRGGA